MNKYQLVAIGLLGLMLGATVIAWQSPARAAAPAGKQAASLTVELTRPQLRNWPHELQLNGSIDAWQEAAISAETGGLRITALHAEVGSVVRKGQVLAELFADSANAEVREAEATLKQARLTLGAARSELDRARSVADGGKIEQGEQALHRAEASLASAEARLSASRITLAQTRIVASDSGVITRRSAQLGQVVSIGSELFTLQRQGRLEWRAEIDASELGQIKPGMAAVLQLADGQQASGRVRQLAPALDSNTRMALAYVDLNPGSSARAGMYASGSVALGLQAARVVPASAVTTRNGKHYVFEVLPSLQVRQREVKLGRRQGQNLELLGLPANPLPLVKSGGGFLNDGDKVQLANGGAVS